MVPSGRRLWFDKPASIAKPPIACAVTTTRKPGNCTIPHSIRAMRAAELTVPRANKVADQAVWGHLPCERLWGDRMHEHGHAKHRRDFKRRPRLRRVDQSIATRAIDEEDVKSQIANGALRFLAACSPS